MIQTITVSDFRDAFRSMGRNKQFSYEGLELIFDYIEEYEQYSGERVELDVIGICCEWAEDTPEEIAATYDIDIEGKDEEEIKQEVIEYLQGETQFAGETDSGTLVYVQF